MVYMPSYSVTEFKWDLAKSLWIPVLPIAVKMGLESL